MEPYSALEPEHEEINNIVFDVLAYVGKSTWKYLFVRPDNYVRRYSVAPLAINIVVRVSFILLAASAYLAMLAWTASILTGA